MSAKVLIVMGSDSDWKIMEKAVQTLAEFQVDYEVHVASAHRTPAKALTLSREAHGRGIDVIIAGAGAAAHLAGVLASETPPACDRRPDQWDLSAGLGRIVRDGSDAFRRAGGYGGHRWRKKRCAACDPDAGHQGCGTAPKIPGAQGQNGQGSGSQG